jgi:hypothetical protein
VTPLFLHNLGTQPLNQGPHLPQILQGEITGCLSASSSLKTPVIAPGTALSLVYWVASISLLRFFICTLHPFWDSILYCLEAMPFRERSSYSLDMSWQSEPHPAEADWGLPTCAKSRDGILRPYCSADYLLEFYTGLYRTFWLLVDLELFLYSPEYTSLKLKPTSPWVTRREVRCAP